MSSQPPSGASKTAAPSSKATAPSGQSSPAGSSITQQFFSSDSSQRRGGSGSGNTRSGPAPRNHQASKPKHKQGKKFRALDEDAEAELFSMQNPHGRKGQTSITHLMNFSLPPRPHQQQQFHRHSYNGPRRGGRVNPTWGLGSGYHSVDKARYVNSDASGDQTRSDKGRYIHANYRFIVDPRGDYHVQAEDADVHLDWNNVLQIIASSKTQEASCPICLGEPTAPRMAKCGHIFCLPCLIRYMHSDDGNGPPPEKRARWKKCPICWDSIYISETRPVRWYIGQESDPPREGGDIVLRLVRRRPGQTLAMPCESAETVLKGEHIPWYFAAEVMDYARVMRGSEDYMIEQYDEALSAIEQLQKEDELMFGEDAEWTGRAIRMLKEAKEKVAGIGNPPEQPKKPEQEQKKPDRPPIQFNEDNDDVPDMYLQRQLERRPTNEQTDGEQPTIVATSNVVPRTLHEMRQRQFEKPQPAEYLFYQGLLHYYLSPLDIRILKTAFGSYHALPSSILPRVERVSSGHVVDDELRKRVKYLAHLPYGCEVAFLECDWTDLVSSEVLAEFKPMLERRRKRHDEKDAREEKERQRIEKAEERELASIRRKRPSIPRDFMSVDGLPSLGENQPVLGSIPNGDAIAASPPWPNRTTSGFTSLASPSTSPNLQRTVWGTTAITPASPDLHASLPRDDEFRHGPDDGWLQGWEKDLLDHKQDQLVGDFGGVSLEEEGVAKSSSASTGGGGGGKKGKKGKKITLMSTATSRRGA